MTSCDGHLLPALCLHSSRVAATKQHTIACLFARAFIKCCSMLVIFDAQVSNIIIVSSGSDILFVKVSLATSHADIIAFL